LILHMCTWTRVAVTLSALTVAGCAATPAPPPNLDYDPLESQNRQAHALNKAVDSAAFRPAAMAYGAALPEPLRNGATNFAQNLNLPFMSIQYLLQGKPVKVIETSLRFAINTTFGLGGLLDPAAEMDLPYDETDVDETLYTWGVPEGGYLEVPFGGPGTQRDWTGFVLDVAVDPLTYLTAGATTYAVVGLRGTDLLHDRYKLDPAIGALYASEDSYDAQRISYLQNMRSRLQGETQIDALEDPYADF
jgi:phospholipid-binding lipoprotein MlaA